METDVRQSQAASIIRDLYSKAQEQSRATEQRDKIAAIAAKYAWALYNDIVETTGKPPVSPAMEARIGVPDDPVYFDDLDAIKEFLDFLGSLGKPRGAG